MRKGTKVIIAVDLRKFQKVSQKVSGETAIFVGEAEENGWLLFKSDGSMECEAHELPEGYIEWNGEKPFPGVNCGVSCPNFIFHLKDGSTIDSLSCYWVPESQKIRDRIRKDAINCCKRLQKNAGKTTTR